MKEINKYGFLNALLGIVNNFDEEDSKVVIAKYLLKNFRNIDNINIFDAADECFVTRASIRRFSKYIGFDNFRNLKTDHEQYSYYEAIERVVDYPEFLANQITQMVHSCNQVLKLELDNMIEKIVACDEIVFLISDVYSSRCLEFQKELILSGKMVRIVSYNFYNNKTLKSMSEHTLLIVISITGGFGKRINEFVQNLHCVKTIMTSIDEQDVTEGYDFVFHVGGINLPASKTIYHSFAVEYYLDIISNEYRKQLER